MQENLTYSEALASNGIFYRLYGEANKGAPLVLVMGYGACMLGWPMDFVAKLARHFKVVIFDNRGTGRSSALAEGLDLRMNHFADDLAKLLESLGFEQAKVFGYSMGGCIALEFARLFPERIESLILLSTTAGGSLYVGADQEVKDRLANPRGSNFDEMFFDFLDLCMSPESLQGHKDVLKGICANARPYPTSPRVLQPQLKAFRYFDASSYVGTLGQRTLLIHGTTDRIVRVENGKMLSAVLPDCTSVFLDNCGHCPHIEYESEIIGRIQDFLS